MGQIQESWQPTPDSCLENPMDRGAWGAKVHGVTKGQTQLKQFSMYACPTETGNTADSQIFILNFGLQFTTTLFSCSNFCPHFCSLGVLSIGVYDLFDSVWNVWVLVHFLTFWHCKMSQAHLVYFLPQSLIQPFLQRFLDSFIRWWHQEPRSERQMY